MQIEIKIDDSCKESRVLILTDSITDEVNDLVKKFSLSEPQFITGFQDETVEIVCMSWKIGLTRTNSPESLTPKSSI